VDKKPLPGVDPRSLAAEGSMDRVAVVDNDLFVTGSQNGSISLWTTQKKKPLFVFPQAHGVEPPLDISQSSAEKAPDANVPPPPPQPRWITALRSIPFSDVILSGSSDGYIRVWKLSADKKKLEAAGVLGSSVEGASHRVNGTASHAPAASGEGSKGGDKVIKGVVNDISVFERGDRSKDGICVVAAIGKEHRLGRWLKVPKGRNGAMVFEVPRTPKAVANGVHSSPDAEDES